MRMTGFELFLLLVNCLLYSNTLLNGFTFDDSSAVVDNKDLRPESSWFKLFQNDFWGTPLDKEQSHKSYRPITVLTLRTNFYFHGLIQWPYHLVNILFHAFAALLYYRVLYRCFRVSCAVSQTASLLFSVHPIHTEAVAGIVGRAETLSSLFFLLTLLSCCSRSNLSYTLNILIWACLATFSKEQGITVLGLCGFLLLDGDLNKKHSLFKSLLNQLRVPKTWKKLSILVFVGLTVLYLRFMALKGGLPSFSSFDNPASKAAFPSKQLTYCYLWSLNFWLLLCPVWLCADWTMDTVPSVTFNDVRVFVLATFIVPLCLLVCYLLFSNDSHFNRLVLVSVFWMFITFLPASNLFFPVGFVIAERVLYLPSMGFCLLVVLGFNRLCSKLPFLKHFLQFYLLILAFRTFGRNFNWKNDWELFNSALMVTKNNAKIYNNLGHYLENEKNLTEALKYFLTATKVSPEDVGSWINSGRVYFQLGQAEQAENVLLKAKNMLLLTSESTKSVMVAPSSLKVFLNLGNLYKSQKRMQEAENIYRQALKLRSDFIEAYMNLGDIYMELEKYSKANTVFSGGLKHGPENSDLLYNAGISFLKMGDSKSALNYFETALEYEPSHFLSLVNSGLILKDNNNNIGKAIERLKSAYDIKPEETIVQKLGNLYFSEGEFEKAEKLYLDALNKRKTKSLLLNLALIQLQIPKPTEAHNNFKAVLEIDPKDIKALLSVCDIYTNHFGIIPEAKKCYEKVLELEEDNAQARHNLCILFIKENLRIEAQNCIKKAEILALKSGPYSQGFVNVLRNKMRLKFGFNK